MLGAHDVELGVLGTLALNMGIFGLLIAGLWRIERRVDSGQTLIALALIAVVGIVGRIILEPLPNISPVTILILLAGAHYGVRHGVALATVIAFVSNLFLGHGLWTLYQAAGWSLVACTGAYLSTWLVNSEGKLNLNRLMVLGFASAFAFDWFVSLSVLHTQPPSYLAPYLIQGFVY
ncbi:MAG TPA: DUF6580 family putative transport protein, partial [Candidatus Thalassarchaeaceae archaeon]|nr:DUF6580 family putative transport protein [Candidatus Thalassarchaeaceae archaeon]